MSFVLNTATSWESNESPAITLAHSYAASRARKTTECEDMRDTKHGLYSLASRLGVNFKGVYPNTLRGDLMYRVKYTRRIKCGGRQKLDCRCDYLTYSLFEVMNTTNDKTAWACYHCLKDLVGEEARNEMHMYHFMREHRNCEQPPLYDIHDYLGERKHKNMVESAHYHGVINDDEKSILLDEACESKQRKGLLKTLTLFWIIGNGYNNAVDYAVIAPGAAPTPA